MSFLIPIAGFVGLLSWSTAIHENVSAGFGLFVLLLETAQHERRRAFDLDFDCFHRWFAALWTALLLYAVAGYVVL